MASIANGLRIQFLAAVSAYPVVPFSPVPVLTPFLPAAASSGCELNDAAVRRFDPQRWSFALPKRFCDLRLAGKLLINLKSMARIRLWLCAGCTVDG
jgi:hypothetical protein